MNLNDATVYYKKQKVSLVVQQHLKIQLAKIGHCNNWF